MKRKVVSLLIISLPVLLAAIMLQRPVTGQSTPTDTNDNALPQPQQLIIRQQIPLSFTIAAPAAVMQLTGPLWLNLALRRVAGECQEETTHAA